MGKRSKTSEFEKFDRAMRKLITVPHDAVKAKLDAEKRAKAKKRKSKTSASGRASRAKG
jgi:hypothetical protein